MGLDANDALVRNLQIQSEKLEDLREGFSQMLAERAFHVYTFQEALGFQGFRGLNGKASSERHRNTFLTRFKDRRGCFICLR